MSKPHPTSHLLRLTIALHLSLGLAPQPSHGQAIATAPLDNPRATATQAKSTAPHPTSFFDVTAGLIQLDVEVTDRSGKPVTGLSRSDFTLLDNGQPSRILSFRAFDGASATVDPRAEVIVVIDMLHLPDRLAAYEQHEVERFLRENGGQLAQPVSIFWLSHTGLWAIAQPSRDGNALAAEVARSSGLGLELRTRNIPGAESIDPLPFNSPPGLSALKALGDLATRERGKTGRKLLLWIGPGWAIGSGAPFFSKLDREQLFAAIHWFSTLLRQARITLYSFSVGERHTYSLADAAPASDTHALEYRNFLAGVKSLEQADIANLDRRVLAIQSGGRVLPQLTI
jgi:VWFA-related protein